MIGLMKKDLYVADKTGRLLLVLARGVRLIPPLRRVRCTYALMLGPMIPLNSIAYDERCKWDRYAAMLPYRPEQLVWSKYLLAYLFTLLGGAVIVVSAAIQRADWRETLEMAALLAVSMLFVTALGLPALYRFGSEKGRYVMILVMGVGVGAALGVMGIFGETPELPDLRLPAVLLLLAALAAGATYVSFRVSVRFYRKRQNGAYT